LFLQKETPSAAVGWKEIAEYFGLTREEAESIFSCFSYPSPRDPTSKLEILSHLDALLRTGEETAEEIEND
jgi:hypothetical protein